MLLHWKTEKLQKQHSFYRLLPTFTDFYLKHFVGFHDAGSAALNTHPKAKRLLGDDSVHEHPGLLVVDSGDP